MNLMFKKHRGLMVIIGLYIVNALIWLQATPIINQPLDSILLQIHGASIILGFTIVFFLSTKNKLVEWLFNGLENSYFYHRVLALISLLFVFIHAQFAYLIVQMFREAIFLDARAIGALARNLFIGLIIIALLAKYLKYEHWRMIHRLMIIPYVLSAYHAFLLSSFPLFSFSIIGIWMMFMVTTGVLSSLYMILIYLKRGLPHKGIVDEVKHLNAQVTEFTIKHDVSYQYQTGQFTFLRFIDAALKDHAHPFTISKYTDNTLTFSVKALGDHTKAIRDNLKKGTKVRFSRAFGHMKFDEYQPNQVWIAGGIGITPFLSHLRSEKTPSQNIKLYYAVNKKEEAVHLDLLETMHRQYSNFSYQLIESDKTGFLTAKDIDITQGTSVFMCGPKIMADTLKKQLKKDHKKLDLTVEAFSFTGTLAEDVISKIQHILPRLSKQS